MLAQEMAEKGEVPPDNLRCKHIGRAREAFCDEMLKLIVHRAPHMGAE
jgi:hypothetical protein